MRKNDPPSTLLSEDDALRAIVAGVEAETGEQFFASLVRHLASALSVQYAFVSELSADRLTFTTRALWVRGALAPNLTVPLAGTPCEAVLHGESAHHPENLLGLFPRDVALADWKAVSYCGVPLLDRAGTVTGHLAIIDDRPMPDGPRGLSILRIFAARACAEIERLATERALRESEARYRDLYDNAPVAYMSFDTHGRLTQWNRRAAELTGYSAEQLAGKHFLELNADSPNGRGRATELNAQFLEGIETLSEVEGMRPDGSGFWVRASVRPLRDAAGRVVATQSVLTDITDRKRAELALAASEERLARILESAMDAIVTFDERLRVELFNDAAEKVFGCPAAEAIGGPLERFLTEGFRRALDTALAEQGNARARSAYVGAGGELAARHADGREFPVEATLSHAEAGGRTLHTLILRDVDERRRAQQDIEQLQEELKSVHNFEEIIGQSRALATALGKVDVVAPTESSVLILGETGTGKELIARAIHSRSPRRGRPLIKVNCAALPSGLVESELFGHERGAFTGATDRRVGRFELADRGTIFLDEVGDMPADTQVKLLRVLQEQEFERVGGSRTIRVDVRIIAATNRDLAAAVAAGEFRQDLYYRLNVFPLHLPPLRERPDDVPLLVHYFVRRYATKIGRQITRVPAEAMDRLAAYPWPGNVRELENVVERAVILSPGPELRLAPEVLPLPATAPTSPGERRAGAGALETVEREHIVSVLKRTAWRVEGPEGAAKLLGLHPNTLRSRMKRLGIRRSHEGAS